MQSVVHQTHTNWEMLIVDDCSTDKSAEVVHAFAKAYDNIHHTKLLKNQGAAHCRNHATKDAKGKYIAFLDADDRWLPNKLERQLNVMSDTNCAVCHTSYEHINEDGEVTGKKINAIQKLTYKKQHLNNYLGNLTGMYNAEMVGKIYAPKIRKRQDWALWLEAIKKSGESAVGIPEVLAQYRVHQGNMSGDKLKLVKYNYHFYRTYLGYNTIKASYWLVRFLWEYFFVRPKYIEIGK